MKITIAIPHLVILLIGIIFVTVAATAIWAGLAEAGGIIVITKRFTQAYIFLGIGVGLTTGFAIAFSLTKTKAS